VRVGIIGLGHVGRAVRTLFEGHADVVAYDEAFDDQYPESDLARSDLAVVCVSTPMLEGGACDTGNVYRAVKRLPVERVLIKSTIPPGTTDRLIAETSKKICFSPEYIRETTYWSSFATAGHDSIPFVILGGAQDVTGALIEDLCPILGPEKVYFQCSALEAEIIKYMENAYLATKVTFVNEFYEICRAFGADWHTVREGWLLDPRIERHHTMVLEKDRGFSGRCLPKDVNAIVHAATVNGYDAEFLRSVISNNRRLRGE